MDKMKCFCTLFKCCASKGSTKGIVKKAPIQLTVTLFSSGPLTVTSPSGPPPRTIPNGALKYYKLEQDRESEMMAPGPIIMR